ncbi:MAG: diphosphate--fructose-6-phosphate 1-phosphotransferase, partial [Muribaculum sp.]|nr:diphosphate--fructose-6-phosphate 1-phosphotransferase [Muribaculum sp.]
GVILSGGQAPGGHNVISCFFDGIKKINKNSRLYGFLMGPGGFVDHQYIELTGDIIDKFRNTGGFDIIGSGRTKLETKSQFDKGLEILKKLDIKALVIIGGDDSNTNAAILAEYYKQINAGVQVIGCPKTIDGDLKNSQIETSFGFDTATKVYSEVIGNIQRDCNSSKKYWHFIKLMGRSASHIALECALQCQPNVCIISEEVEAKKMTLNDVVNYIADIVARRAEEGCNFGSVLIPEGLIEFIPAMKALIAELNDLLAAHAAEFTTVEPNNRISWVADRLSVENAKIFLSLPEGVAQQLCLDRDPHGNVQVSLIETEKLLGVMVGRRLNEMKADGKYIGKFASLYHFFGYEGRCADPSNFDADYCYALGYNAAQLIRSGVTGYMSSVRNLTKPSVQWMAGGIPITMMMNMERRHGAMKPVIQKALVDLNGNPFKKFASKRDKWAINTDFVYPGPIQYFGPAEVCDQPSLTLKYEHQN